MKNRRPRSVPIEGPAIVTAGHVRDRVLPGPAGSQKGWSRHTPYERAFKSGQLLCKDRCTGVAQTRLEEARAFARFEAARDFDLGWQMCCARFPRGMDFDRVRTSGGTPGGFADHQRDAKDFWRGVRAGMSANDWMICRMACAEGYSVAQAVMAVSPAYRCTTVVRFREALDGLVTALRAAKMPARRAAQPETP